jgi:hypothetical protein
MAETKNKTGASVRISADWIENTPNEGATLKTLDELTVADFIADDYQLSNQVKLNSNGTKYLLCIDKQTNKKAALYMFKAMAESVKENQLLTKEQIAIFLVENTEDGKKGFVIGQPGFKGGISFFA